MTSDPRSARDRSVELPVTSDRIVRSIDEELRLHMEERIAELTAGGLPATESRTQAAREFGDIESARAELRRIDLRSARRDWAVSLVGDLGADLRRTVRALVNCPAFTIIAVLTLALGIGANAGMFTVVDRLVLSPPPHIAEAAAVFPLVFDHANVQNGGRIPWHSGSYRSLVVLSGQHSGASVTGYVSLPLMLADGGATQELQAVAVAPNYFVLFGPHPAVGRFFTGDAASADDARAAVISHELWARRFERGDVIGREVRLAGEVYTIVGVAPRGFSGERVEPIDAWIPLGAFTPTLRAGWQSQATGPRVTMIARLRPNVTVEAATAEATRVYRTSIDGTPNDDSTARVRFAPLSPGRDIGNGEIRPETRVALWLQLVSVLVLLIAIANVTNLLILRAIERQRETAVRLSLGISRLRFVRHLMLESLLLAAAGGIAAVVLARWGGGALWSLIAPAGAVLGADTTRITMVTAAVVIVAALIMTVVPALLQRSLALRDLLGGSSRGATRRGSALGETLLIVQVSLTVVLLVGAGLFTRSFRRVGELDMGFASRPVVGVGVRLSAVPDTAARQPILRRVSEAVRATPGVQETAVAMSVAFRPSLRPRLVLPGRDDLPGVSATGLGYPTLLPVSPEYFSVLSIPILRGRGFTASDNAARAPVMVIDATMARAFWPNGDAIGRCLHIASDTMPCVEIVGIAGDMRRSVTDTRPMLHYFIPLDQATFGRNTDRYVFARTSRDANEMIGTMRAAVAAASPSTPFGDVFAVTPWLDPRSRRWQLGTSAFVAFGALATVIATIGLYGVISFGVAQRERELGIRRALGAATSSLMRGVLISASLRSLVGLAVGGVLSIVLTRRLWELLFQPSLEDARVFVVAVAIVLTATVAASAGPAWRAMRADPMKALRAE